MRFRDFFIFDQIRDFEISSFFIKFVDFAWTQYHGEKFLRFRDFLIFDQIRQNVKAGKQNMNRGGTPQKERDIIWPGDTPIGLLLAAGGGRRYIEKERPQSSLGKKYMY